MVMDNCAAGHLRTKSDRHATIMVVSNLCVAEPADVLHITDDRARILEAVYKDL